VKQPKGTLVRRFQHVVVNKLVIQEQFNHVSRQLEPQAVPSVRSKRQQWRTAPIRRLSCPIQRIKTASLESPVSNPMYAYPAWLEDPCSPIQRGVDQGLTWYMVKPVFDGAVLEHWPVIKQQSLASLVAQPRFVDSYNSSAAGHVAQLTPRMVEAPDGLIEIRVPARQVIGG
jgi:hypothetical protein